MKAEQSPPVLKCKNIVASPQGLAEADCRLVFSKATPLNDIQDFCEKVRATYKYKISEDV
jgi:hypothetical protein